MKTKNGSGRWNVQYIHHHQPFPFTNTLLTSSVQHSNDTTAGNVYPTIDNNIGPSPDEEEEEEEDDGHDAAAADDDDHYRDDDDDDDGHSNHATTRNHRHRHPNRCCCGSSSSGGYYGNCYEFWNTWFYTLAYQRTIVLIFILFTTYTGIVLFYATIYYTMSHIGQAIHDHSQQQQHYHPDTVTTTTRWNIISNGNHTADHLTDMTKHTFSVVLLYFFCDMDLHTPMEAIFFSLSTMASIGYGVSDYYFGNCGIVPLLVVLLQICTAICYDAIAIGLLFQRLRRSHKRSKSIIFTNTAIVQRIQTIPYFMIRTAELRHYPLVNATIRAYCIYHDRHPIPTMNHTFTASTESNPTYDSTSTTTCTNPSITTPNTNQIHTTYYVTKPVKLLQHDILMNIPQMIVHPIQMNESPLCPPSIWYDRSGTKHYYSRPPNDGTTVTSGDNVANHHWMTEDMEQMQRYMQDRNMEIIIVIEGTDELTGTCTQTKQSYTYEDIQWNHQFVSCMHPANITTTTNHAGITSIMEDPNRHHYRNSRASHQRNRHGGCGCIVDFASFHSVEPSPINSDFSPYIA
jgi:hypothetical protein